MISEEQFRASLKAADEYQLSPAATELLKEIRGHLVALESRGLQYEVKRHLPMHSPAIGWMLVVKPTPPRPEPARDKDGGILIPEEFAKVILQQAGQTLKGRPVVAKEFAAKHRTFVVVDSEYLPAPVRIPEVADNEGGFLLPAVSNGVLEKIKNHDLVIQGRQRLSWSCLLQPDSSEPECDQPAIVPDTKGA